MKKLYILVIYVLLFPVLSYAQTTQPPETLIRNALQPSMLNQPNGVAQLDANSKVMSASLTNRPTIAPLTTTVGTSPTTIFPAGTYLSIRLALASSGTLACTGDGSTPALGGTGQAVYGQDIHWPVAAGGAMPTGVVKCIAASSSSITTEAH